VQPSEPNVPPRPVLLPPLVDGIHISEYRLIAFVSGRRFHGPLGSSRCRWVPWSRGAQDGAGQGAYLRRVELTRVEVGGHGRPHGLRPHDLRHTAASLAIGAGANVKAVQQMLGTRPQ
jgi:integrase